MNDTRRPKLRVIHGRFCICRFPPSFSLFQTLSTGIWEQRLCGPPNDRPVDSASDSRPRQASDELDRAEPPESWWTVAKTAREWSLVIPECWLSELLDESAVAAQPTKVERGRRLFEVEGPLPMDWIGILAGLSQVLAEAKISIFCVSTFDTDYLLVEASCLESAKLALKAAGYAVDS